MNKTISRRGFLGSLSAFGAFAGCDSLKLASGGRPLVRFGVVSDVHVRLAQDGRSLEASYDTATLERTFAYFRDCGVDAVMIAGDMADTGLLGELKALADAWYKVFPNDRAPDGRKVERLFVYGNHDAYGLTNGKRVYKDAADVRREALEADPRRTWDICFHEEWKPYFVKTVNGFSFFCSHWQPGIWCNGHAETGCSGCADAFRDIMARCDPLKPFFYVQHPHPRETVYEKDAWGMDDGTATKLLSAFPQAIAFSGHSHEPLTNERAIWRGSFTSVATGSLRYLAAGAVWNRAHTAGYENGSCNFYLPGVERKDRQNYSVRYDAPKLMPVETNHMDIRVGQVVSVYEDRVEFAKREFESGLSLGEDWIVELPAKPRAFRDRAKSSSPAEFPDGAALKVSRTTATSRGFKRSAVVVPQENKPAIRLEFPSATVGGQVAEYEISAENAAGKRYSTRICAVNGLYPRRHAKFAKPAYATIPAAAIPEGAATIRVTPLDSYGNRGKSIEASLA